MKFVARTRLTGHCISQLSEMLATPREGNTDHLGFPLNARANPLIARRGLLRLVSADFTGLSRYQAQKSGPRDLRACRSRDSKGYGHHGPTA